MNLQKCSHCGVLVIPSEDGTCPSCQQVAVPEAPEQSDAAPAETASREPAASRRNQGSGNSTGGYGVRVGLVSVFSPLISFLLLLASKYAGAGNGAFCVLWIGSAASVVLGVLACIRGGEERRKLATGLGVLGIVLGICFAVAVVFSGLSAQKKARMQFEQEMRKYQENMEHTQ